MDVDRIVKKFLPTGPIDPLFMWLISIPIWFFHPAPVPGLLILTGPAWIVLCPFRTRVILASVCLLLSLIAPGR